MEINDAYWGARTLTDPNNGVFVDSLTYDASINASNIVTSITLGGHVTGAKLSFAAKNGLVTGSFTNAVPVGKKTTLKGVYLQAGNEIYGYYLGTNQNQSGSLYFHQH